MSTEFKVIIAGSREFVDFEFMCDHMDRWCARSGATPADMIVLWGKSRGADEQGRRWAESRGILWALYEADWASFPNTGGFMRNTAMIVDATHLVAFWDGNSPGTRDTISKAARRRMNMDIVHYNRRQNTLKTLW